MKLTFPHMGNLYLIAKPMFEELGYDVIVPPKNNGKTLEIGKKYAPEFICMPLKLNIGNYIQAMELGADTIVMLGGCGPCRFGYYGVLQKEILKDAGFDVEMFIIEPLVYGVKSFFKNASKLFKKRNTIPVLIKSFNLSIMVDNLERKVHFLRPREKVKGSVDKIYHGFKNEAFKTKGICEMKKLIEKTDKLLDSVHIVDGHIPKLGIVGEIFTIIDDYSNMNIEKIIADLGFEVDRNLYISSWIDNHIIKPVLNMKDNITEKYSKGIIDRLIGGHARESISYAKWFSDRDFCGIIHILPLTCMPEIVAKSILYSIKDDLNVPMMSIVIDELESDVGIRTRIEAFIDLINTRGGKVDKGRMFSWN